ncbi:S8 family peptidase [Lentzea sp. NPDC051838]|uniref:S8 family peptidase n=1 Tax=Lentzea sp. NPDC051838 TaxID=3154849 RepID=UPI003435B98B
MGSLGRLSVVALALVAMATPAVAEEPVGAVLRAGGATAIADSYIVVFKDSAVGRAGVGSSATRLSGRHGGTVARTFSAALRGAEIRMNAKAAARTAADPAVAFVEQNHVVSGYDTQAFPPSYGLDRIDQRNLPRDSSYTYPNAAGNVTAYVIDSGIRTTHADFRGRASFGVNTTGDGINSDCNGHGTHVAGTVGGFEFGVAKAVRLVAVKVLGCGNTGSVAGIIDGVNWVTSNAVRPAVANMSLGVLGGSSALDTAVTNSINSGITIAVAAGNENSDACRPSPARNPLAITVGAVDSGDARASFSNIGMCVDIFAPGSNIPSLANSDDTSSTIMSGTSMSSPHAAGAAALVLGANPSFTPQQVRDTLVNSATNNVITNVGNASPNKLLYVRELIPPPPPAPGPGNCTVSNNGNSASSLCTTGVGQHRVVMVQRHFDPAVGLIACEGPWVGVGEISFTRCASHQVISVRVETRT